MNSNSTTRILVIDDDEFSRDILQNYLDGCGFCVSIVGNSDTALQHLQDSEHVDLILVDRMLSRIDGLDLVRKIRAEEKFHDLPIVIESALAMPEQVLEGLEAGANYYLTKPYNLPLLCEAIKSVLVLKRKKNNCTEIDHSEIGCNCTTLDKTCPMERWSTTTVGDDASIASLTGRPP
jgi:DNA-binding response OmpR family regulator